MKLIKKAKSGLRYVFNKNYRFLINCNLGLYDKLSDEEYLKRKFKIRVGYELNLESPKTFNEKLQWLKLNYRKPEFTEMVDKYAVRDIIKNKIGEEYLIPLLGVWDSPNDIDFDKLPNQFVLKTTHGCGGMVICRDKCDFNARKAKKVLKKALKRNYFYNMREWPYKDVVKRVIAEKYLQDGDERNLKVFKVFNFNGEPKIIQTIQNDKTANESIDYFDTDWNLIDMHQNYPNSQNHVPKPKTLDKMLELSKKCSEGFPFIRTDWYEVNGKVYFSEFTFYSDAGMEPFHPEKWDDILGDWINLPKTAK